jgi:broad specificity phosphatase PhoE
MGLMYPNPLLIFPSKLLEFSNGKIMAMSLQSANEYHVTLLRHGESVGNAEGFAQGQSEFPLTDKGRAQVQALAKKWSSSNQHFDTLISSPQLRASKTAEIIASALGNAIKFDPIWMERDNGIHSGLRHEEAREKFPHPEFLPIYEPVGKTGESAWELYLRGGKAILSILQNPPGRYLVVSHGGILNMSIKAALGIVPQANFQGPRFRFQNSAFASLMYFPDRHTWLINGINQRPHWVEDD